jgi:hypothetical protein
MDQDAEVLKLLLAEKTYIDGDSTPTLTCSTRLSPWASLPWLPRSAGFFPQMSFYPRTAKSWSCWRS